MEKKLAVIVDNKEITTEVTDTEMCSSACDVAMETCSSECHDTCGDGSTAFPQKARRTYQRKSRVWRGRGQSTVR